nr:30S ribosome-binding factor RbfA [Desulfobulbaceae bacterium]
MVARKKSKTQYSLPELGQATGKKRPARVAETIRTLLAELLLRKVRDPRVYGTSLSGVDMTPDLRTAVIYFCCPEGQEADVQEGLDSAQGFLRTQLAKSLTLRYMPTLVFKHDLSITHHSEMGKIFREIEDERRSTKQDS